MYKQFGKKKQLTIVSILLSAVLLLASCGAKETPAGAEGNGGANGEATTESTQESGGASDSGPGSVTVDKKSPVNIFKIGNDSFAVLINSDECEKLLPKGEHEESDNRMTLRNEDWSFQVGLSSFYANFSYKAGEDDWRNVDSGYLKNRVTKDMYFVAFCEKDICSQLPSSGELILTAYKTSDSEEREVLKVDAAKVIQSIDVLQYADIVGQAYGAVKPVGDWEGTYLTDSYSELQGKAEVKVTDSGAIYVKTNMHGYAEEFVLVEELLEGSDDPYFYSNGTVLNAGGGSSVNFQFQYTRADYGDGDINEFLTFNYDDWEKGLSEHADFYKFELWHAAKADYKDEDVTGKLTFNDPDDSKYFKPVNSDYLIKADYADEFTGQGIICDRYSLYSFDSLGRIVQYNEKYVLSSAADAQILYDDRTKYPTDVITYTMIGNTVYSEYDVAKEGMVYNSSKCDLLFMYYNWKLGCNYINGWQREDGTYYNQAYISKPYTEKEYNVSVDDAFYWSKVSGGNYRCNEFKDSYMGVEASDSHFSIWFNGAVDSEGNRLAPVTELRINGQNITAAGAVLQYNYSTYQYDKYIAFTEMEFGEKETKVTQYLFSTDNAYDDRFTFENYKSQTPDLTLTATFDMEHKE